MFELFIPSAEPQLIKEILGQEVAQDLTVQKEWKL